MALTTQQSIHCNDCDGKHLPGEPHVPQPRPRNGGRHLAPKKAGSLARPRRQAAPRRLAPRPKVEPQAMKLSLPSAEDLGTSAAHLLKKMITGGRNLVRGTARSWRQWWSQTKKGLHDLIDLESLTSAAEESRHVEKAVRPARPSRSRHAAPPVGRPGPTRVATAPKAVPGQNLEVTDRGASSREHLLEVSVLESLGFFDPANEIVVTTGPITVRLQEEAGAPASATTVPVPKPWPEGRSLIPDIDLLSWRPRVIARSKLGKGRYSTMMITILSVTLLILAVVVANLLRAPAEQVVREENTLTEASTGLAVALSGLEPVLADVTADVAEATSTLISVESAARGLFEAAALLGDDPEQQVLRQSAAGLAQRSMALESSVGDALNYRRVLDPLWDSPDLVGVAEPTEAAAAIAAWQARLGDMVASLPDTSELEAHVDQVRRFAEGLDGWRVRYLDALSLSDLTTAEGAVADLDGQLALLAQSGEDVLSGLFADASTERSRIVDDLAAIAG